MNCHDRFLYAVDARPTYRIMWFQVCYCFRIKCWHSICFVANQSMKDFEDEILLSPPFHIQREGRKKTSFCLRHESYSHSFHHFVNYSINLGTSWCLDNWYIANTICLGFKVMFNRNLEDSLKFNVNVNVNVNVNCKVLQKWGDKAPGTPFQYEAGGFDSS